MYPIVSTASILARFYLCYITIEQLPIFANGSINWVVGQIISIYTIFRLICYPIVGRISQDFGIKSAVTKSVLYFILYLPLIGVYWLLLLLFTHVFRVLPIQ
jgi:MFS family permease